MISLGRQKAVNSSKTYSNRSFKTAEDSNFLCSTCKNSQEDLKTQITQLKQKAHQSFMQVLQIQQLHEEQINQMKEQWLLREHELLQLAHSLQEELKVVKSDMEQLEKNAKRHNYDFDTKELMIDNIDSIGCEDDDRSYLDESSLLQFKELLSVKNASDYVASLRREIYKDFKFVSNNKTQIEKLFMVIRDLKDENSQLHKLNQIYKQKIVKSETQMQETKTALDHAQRENKFISENLKRLGNDKFNLQKKVNELEKAKSHEDLWLTLNKQKTSYQREDSGEKSEKMLEVLHEASELSLTSSKREINELNYAKFMVPDQIESQENSPVDVHMRRSPQRKMIH